MFFYAQIGGIFQKWKYFPEKKLRRLLTHAPPNNTNALNHSTHLTTTIKITLTKNPHNH
jgi:hypothetical protein